MREDGGATANQLLIQFHSDLSNTPVFRPAIPETTQLGAAYLAGLAVGYWNNIDEIQAQWKAETTFEPAMGTEERTKLDQGWQRAVRAAIAWANDQ